MRIRHARLLVGATLALGLVVPAAHAQTQTRVEKIRLQHIDPRILAALTGALVLPNEAEVAMQRLQGGGSYGYGASPGYGAYPGNGGYYGNFPYSQLGTNGYAPVSGQSAGGQAPWFTRGTPQPVGAVADPNSNSLILRR